MTYETLLERLVLNRDEQFCVFQKSLIFTKQTIIGVRTPILKKFAKEIVKSGETEQVLSFPSEYFEVTMIKLFAAATLDFDRLVLHLEPLLKDVDNWAACDGFKPVAVKRSREQFLPYLERCFAFGEPFFVRFTLVTLLNFYIDEEYLPLIKSYLTRTNTQPYYVRMAAAWLVAEILIKQYAFGLELLIDGFLDKNTHNKAIQKARESFRLNKEQKAYLLTLKK